MQIHLRFLDGIVTIEKPSFTHRDLFLAIKDHTRGSNSLPYEDLDMEKDYLGVFPNQVIIRCECENEHHYQSHEIKDGDLFNIAIKPIFVISYVHGFDVCQFYLKNGDSVRNHLNEIIWVNISGGSCSILKWVENDKDGSVKQKIVSTMLEEWQPPRVLRQKLQELYNSNNITSIAKERIAYLLQN